MLSMRFHFGRHLLSSKELRREASGLVLLVDLVPLSPVGHDDVVHIRLVADVLAWGGQQLVDGAREEVDVAARVLRTKGVTLTRELAPGAGRDARGWGGRERTWTIWLTSSFPSSNWAKASHRWISLCAAVALQLDVVLFLSRCRKPTSRRAVLASRLRHPRGQ